MKDKWLAIISVTACLAGSVHAQNSSVRSNDLAFKKSKGLLLVHLDFFADADDIHVQAALGCLLKLETPLLDMINKREE